MSPSDGKIDELVAKASELIREVSALNKDSGRQILDLAHANQNNRRMIWALAASFALDVILTALIAVGFIQVSNNTDDIERVADRVATQQAVQRDAALCPLYRIFLDAENRPPPNLTEQQKRDRVEGFKILHKSYEALECERIIKR